MLQFKGWCVVVAFASIWPIMRQVVHAQEVSIVQGAVTDPTGGVVADAMVVVTADTGEVRETRTGQDGRYVFTGLRPGTWTILVVREGFRMEPRRLVLGEVPVSADVVLEPALEETVTVLGRVEVPRSASAAKTDSRIQDLPFSVQALSSTLLHDQRALTIAEAMRNVSGVAQQVGFGGLNTRFTIRGFRPPAQLKNGFRQNTFIPMLDLQNAQEVEVLKGPASALYGAFEPGGVTNIATKRPLPVRRHVVEVTGGSYGQFRPSIDTTGPLGGSRAQYRLNAAFDRGDSHRDFYTSRVAFVAPVVQFELSSRTRLTVEGEYLRRTGGFDRGFGNHPLVLTLPPERNLGEPTDEGTNTTWLGSYVVTHQINSQWTFRHGLMAGQARLQAFYFAGGFPLLSGTRYNRRPQRTEDAQHDLTVQTEAVGRFSTGRVRHQLLVGAEAGRDFWSFRSQRAPVSSIDLSAPVYGAVPGPFSPFSDGEVRIVLGGLYVQDQVQLGQKVKALVGARYSAADQQEINRLVNSDRSGFSGSVSPRVGLVIEPRREVSLYASLSRSTRADTLVVVRGGQLPEPSTGTQSEAGVKLSLFDERFLGTISAYRLVKTAVPVADPADPFAPMLQVGEQIVHGFELDAAGEPVRGLRVLVSAAVTAGEITRDTTIPLGTRLLNIPDRSATLWATYALPVGRLEGFGFGGGVFHTGRRAANAAASFFLPPYTLLDATLFFERGRYRVAVNGKNLRNERYFESGGGFVAAYPGSRARSSPRSRRGSEDRARRPCDLPRLPGGAAGRMHRLWDGAVSSGLVRGARPADFDRSTVGGDHLCDH